MSVTLQQFNSIVAGADQRLRNHREAKRDEYFRDGLYGYTGEIAIAGEIFHPADVLERMANESCRVARAESDQRFLEEAADAVLDTYPMPVALAYNAFLHGATNSLTRLSHMRDTWEAVVNVCFAVVLTECAARNEKLTQVVMRDGPNNNPRPLGKRDLKSDSIAVRLGVIEGILVYLKHVGIASDAAQLVPVEVIGEMRRLNDVRNSFSHEQTKSEAQAAKIIEECEGDMLDVLVDLGGFAEVEIYRVHEIDNAQPNTLRVERLNGSNTTRRILPMSVTPPDIGLCGGAARPGDFDPIFIRCRGLMYLASPYLYCRHDDTGHQTRVLMLKRVMASEAKAKFELIGHSVAVEIDLPRLQPEIDRIERLLDL